jgi:hypothetical protein
MGNGRVSLRSRLQAALDRRDVVRIRRTIRRAEAIDGVIVGLSSRWVLVHELWDGVRLNGYRAVRVEDVRSVVVRGDQEGFTWRALRHYGEIPAMPDGVDLATTRTLIDTASKLFPLVVVGLDLEDPTIVWIGSPTRTTSRTLHLRYINPDGAWDDDSTGFPLREITAVGFAGVYETALHDAGDDPS